MKLNKDTKNLMEIIFNDNDKTKNIKSNKILLDRISDRLEDINIDRYKVDKEFNCFNRVFHIINNTSVMYLGTYKKWIMLDTEDLVYIRHSKMKKNSTIKVTACIESA